MEEYYPSEIARLVLGYLDEVRCTKTWHAFLEESSNLQEHNNLLKHGKRCTTNVRGESLLDVLKVYSALKSFFEQIICQYSWKGVLDDISYLQEQYNVHKQKSCYSTQRTGQSVVNSLREWISEISSTNGSGSDADQIVYTDLPYYPSSLISLKSHTKNASQSDKNCQKTTDKSIQTDLFSCACLQKTEKTSSQLVGTSEERSEYPESNVIDSIPDQEGTQNKLPLNLAEQGVTQISEGSKHCDSANKHSSPESLSFDSSLCLLNPEKYGKEELPKEKSPQEKNHQVKRNLFKDSSQTKNPHLSETPLKWANAENETMEKETEHLGKLPEVVKAVFDNCDRPDSNFSSNIDSIVTEYADLQNQISSLAETNEYAGECNETVPYDLSAKADIKQISKINGNGDPTTNNFALREVPSDNNSSFLNSEHDLQIIESELDSHVSDNEMNVGDTTIIPLHTSDLHPIDNMPLGHSNIENQSSQKEEECTLNVTAQLPSLANSSHSVENIAAVTPDTEMIDKIETANDNTGFVVLPNEINCLNTTVPSEKQGVWEANGNTIVNESHNVVKSTDDFILMNNPQYSVISPPDQSNAVLSYTTVPELTMLNISSDLSAQNNIQYKLVLNTPINWNVPIANGLSLVPPQRLSLVPSLPLPNVSKPPVISPVSTTVVPTPLLSNVPQQLAFATSSSTVLSTLPLPSAASQAPASSIAESNVAYFETVVSDNLNDNTKSVPVVKKTKTDPKKCNSSKQKVKEQKNGKEESKSTAGKRPYAKRLPKRKRRPLFGSTPKPKEAPLAEKIPVLSITESPCKTASNVVTKITDDFADQCKSPVLKLLMTSAKEMLKTSNTSSSSHVRCLDFDSKSAASDEILIIDEINKYQGNNKSENVAEMLVRKEVQNSKSLVNGNVHNEQCASKVTNKIPDCTENSKKRTINDASSNDRKTKLKKQCKREKRTSKKSITPQKAKGKTKNSKSLKSPKKASKIQKKVKFQENDTASIQGKKKTSPKKNKKKCNKFPMSERNCDAAINEENMSPKKYNMTYSRKDEADGINAFSVSPKRCFQLKTYENLSKIKSHEVVKEDAVKELHNKCSQSQNEKVIQETVITAAERDKSPSKNYEVQNKKCTLDESPRKSQRIANKVTAASSNKEFFISDRKESQNESSGHCKVNAVLDDKLSKVLHNTVSEYSNDETTSKNHLSPQRNRENKYCKSKQKTQKKFDKLQNNKTENIDKNAIISLNEVNESFNVSDEATHSTPVGNPQKCIDMIGDNEINKSLDISTVVFENKSCQITTCDKNYEKLKDKDKTKCISEKYSEKNYIEKNKETVFKNICNTSELNDISKDKSSKKGDEKQYSNTNKNNKMQNIRKGTVENKEMSVNDVKHKSQKESSIVQNIAESNKLSENSQIPSYNVNDKLKNIEKAANNVEKSQNFCKMIVFDSSSELETLNDNNNNPEEEMEYSIYNDLTVDDNIQLKGKIVFSDPDFKLQEVSKNERKCLKKISQQKSIDKIQTSIAKDNSKISTLEESVMHLRDIKKTKKDFISSTSAINCTTSTNLQQQKYKKDFESHITCTTVINKRKMTHPKKRIKQNYLDAQEDLRNSVQDTVEKIKHLASISPDAVSVLNSIEISNNSVKFSHSNLELNSSKESNSKSTLNVSCSSFSNEKITDLNIDDAFKNKEINSARDNEDISKNYDTDNLNSSNTSKSSIITSKISEVAAIKSHLDVGNTESNLNEVNSLDDNVKENLTTDVLQISSSKQSEDIVLLEEVEGHFIAGKECNLNTNTTDGNTDNLDSVKSIFLSPNSCNKQTNIDLSNHSSNGSFHSISSNSNEGASSNMSSAVYNDAEERILQMPETVNYVSDDVFIDVGGISSTSVREKNVCDTTSDPPKMPEKRKDTVFDSPLPAMKRICRKLSSSSDEMYSSSSKSKSNEQKEKSYSNKANTKAESSQLLGRNFVGKQKLNKKLKTVQESPVRCLQKVKKVLPKTALRKRIEKDPTIPAGVKIPYKWNNSKIITYSNEIRQSTKNTKKNANKNMVTEVNEKEGCSDRKQILKPVEYKINKDKQNFIKELPKNCKLEPRVMLTRLCANNMPKIQCSLNSNTEEKMDEQNILLHGDHQQITEAVPEGNAGIITNNPENSTLSHSIPSQSIMQHFETTQDMVEADIGRSNDEGSELSIAIKNCEKELFSSKSVRLSSSPEKPPPFPPEKETSQNENNSVDQPEKTASLPENNSPEQLENKASNVENNQKLAMIRSLVEKYGAEWLLQKIDDL